LILAIVNIKKGNIISALQNKGINK